MRPMLLGSFFMAGYLVLVGHVSRMKDTEKATQVQPGPPIGGAAHATTTTQKKNMQPHGPKQHTSHGLLTGMLVMPPS